MITQLVIAIASFGIGARSAEPPTIDLIVAIHRAAHLGLGDTPLPPFERERAIPTVEVCGTTSFPLTRYSFGYCSVYVDNGRNRVSGIDIGDPVEDLNRRRANGPVKRSLTDAQLVELAKRYYKVAGYADDVEILDIRYGVVDRYSGVAVEFIRKWKGVPFEFRFQGSMRIDPENGRLNGFHADGRDFPLPPETTVAGISAETALNAAAAKVLGEWASVLTPAPKNACRLCIAAPFTKPHSPWAVDYRSDAEARLENQKTGRLVYDVNLEDLTVETKVQGFERRYVARVDARSGQVLQVARYPEAGGSGGGDETTVNTKQATAKGLWSFVSPKGDLAPIGEASIVPTTTRHAQAGRQVYLKCGDIFFSGLFDKRTKLLWVRRGPGMAVPTKPSGLLLQKLMR